MPVIEHQDHCPYCDALISVFIELPDQQPDDSNDFSRHPDYCDEDQQQDCQVCCRPIAVRLRSEYLSASEPLSIQLLTADDV